MVAEKEKIIGYFCERFLQVDETPANFTAILNMGPEVIKGINKKDIEILTKKGYKKIRDLSKIKISDIEKVANKLGIDFNNMQKYVLAAHLISRAWKKRSKYLKKDEVKIGIMGLDNAGKTSLLDYMIERSNLGNLINIEPTIGVDIRKFSSENFNISIWDFGGQIGHRHDYLNNPEDYFLKIDLIIYVIDMQDDNRYEESLDYFKNILEIIEFLNEHPFFLILQHKCDPDIADDPEFIIQLEYVRGKFAEILNNYKFPYDIIETSIFNIYTQEPEFAKLFKSFFSKKNEQRSIAENFEFLSSNIENLTLTMMEQFELIRNVIDSNMKKLYTLIGKIAAGEKTDNLIQEDIESLKKDFLKHEFRKSIKESLVPPPPPPPSTMRQTSITSAMQGDPRSRIGRSIPDNANKTPSSDPMSVRMNLMNELKEILKIRRIVG